MYRKFFIATIFGFLVGLSSYKWNSEVKQSIDGNEVLSSHIQPKETLVARLPSSVRSEGVKKGPSTKNLLLKDFIHRLPPHLRNRVDLEILQSFDNLLITRTLIDKVAVEFSDQRWHLNPQTKVARAENHDYSLLTRSLLEFRELNDTELREIVAQVLDQESAELIEMKTLHPLWARSTQHKLVPTYEVEVTFTKVESNRISETWRIDSDRLTVMGRFPRSKHGGAAAMGIPLKSNENQ